MHMSSPFDIIELSHNTKKPQFVDFSKILYFIVKNAMLLYLL